MVILYLLHHFCWSASSQITKVSDQMHLIVITGIMGYLFPVAKACPVSPDRVLEAGNARQGLWRNSGALQGLSLKLPLTEADRAVG